MDGCTAFRTGVARLALSSGAPVIPVGLVGTDGVLVEGDRRWHRSHVEVRFGPPLEFAGRSEDRRSSSALREVTEAVRVAVQALSGQEYVDRYGQLGQGRHLGHPTGPRRPYLSSASPGRVDRSADGVTPVDEEVCTVDHGRGVRGQEEGRGRDLLRQGEPPGRGSAP